MAEITFVFCERCNKDCDMSTERRGRGYLAATEEQAILLYSWHYDKEYKLICPDCYEDLKKQNNNK